MICISATAQTFPADDAIHDILRRRIGADSGVGIIIGMIDRDGTRIISDGAPGIGRNHPLDGNTVFEIGSITKVFTSQILADMVARNEVQLSDPITRYLPPGVRAPAKDGRQITLLDLSTQTSGLPGLPANFEPADEENPYVDYTVDQLYEFLGTHVLRREPGKEYEYSNLGVGLLGHLLSLKAGKSYEELVTERILKPLGMNDTRITLTPDMRTRLAAGHNEIGDSVSNWDIPTLAGAGAFRSTMNDMLKFLAANLGTASAPLSDLYAMPHQVRRSTGTSGVDVGLGWHIFHKFGRDIVWHNGGTGGYRSFIGFDSARGMGIVALINLADGVDDIALHLLEEKFPLNKSEFTVATEVMQHYVGEYQLAPGFTIIVRRNGTHLMVQATGQQEFPIFATSETEFFLKAVDAQITFVPGTDGKTKALVLHQGGTDTEGKKIR